MIWTLGILGVVTLLAFAGGVVWKFSGIDTQDQAANESPVKMGSFPTAPTLAWSVNCPSGQRPGWSVVGQLVISQCGDSNGHSGSVTATDVDTGNTVWTSEQGSSWCVGPIEDHAVCTTQDGIVSVDLASGETHEIAAGRMVVGIHDGRLISARIDSNTLLSSSSGTIDDPEADWSIDSDTDQCDSGLNYFARPLGVVGDVGTIAGYAFNLTNGERTNPAGSIVESQVGDVALITRSCSNMSQYSVISLDGTVIGSYNSTVLGSVQSDVYLVREQSPSRGQLEDVTAVDAKTHGELWRGSIQSGFDIHENFMATADTLLSFYHSDEPHAYSIRTGDELWTSAEKFERYAPVVDADGRMIFTNDSNEVVAVDGATGESLWTVDAGGPAYLFACREGFIVTTDSATTYYAPTGR